MLGLEVALVAVALSLAGASYRFFRGPTLPDRVVALDTVSTNLVVVAVLEAIRSGDGFYVSIAIVLAVVGFLSTVAVSKFLMEGEMVD